MKYYKGKQEYDDTSPEFFWKWVAILKDGRVISQFDLDPTGKGVFHSQDEFLPSDVRELVITKGTNPEDTHVIKADKDNQEIRLILNVDTTIGGGETKQEYNFAIEIKEGDTKNEIPVEALSGG